jgi:CheY-like chemotaxis protein
MDGTEVARRIREMEPEGRQAVLLAVTAYCTEDDRQLCLQAGMDAFVGKPLTPEKLRRVLLDIGRRQLTAASVPAVPSTPAEHPDLELLAYLSGGSADGLDAQIDRFLAALEETEVQMVAASAAQDYAELGSSAHRLLGQARLVGSAPLVDIAMRLEIAARSREQAVCAERLGRVRQEIEALTAAMRHRRSAAPSA